MDISPTELDGSFEPLQRARSNTWPLPRPDNFDESSMSPTVTRNGDAVVGVAADSTNGGTAVVDNLGLDTKCGVIPELIGGASLNAAAAAAYHCNQLKKGSSRRNAWGNLSYADLITQAINSSPEKRLTLSQIYEWMVHNVPYFKDKGDNNSSAGWKVSRLDYRFSKFPVVDQNFRSLALRTVVHTYSFRSSRASFTILLSARYQLNMH